MDYSDVKLFPLKFRSARAGNGPQRGRRGPRMPKDTGSIVNNTVMLAERRAARSADDATTVGGQLRAQREAQGLTLQHVAEVTRVRRAYLAAIEDMRADLLPSRPFAVGYA